MGDTAGFISCCIGFIVIIFGGLITILIWDSTKRMCFSFEDQNECIYNKDILDVTYSTKCQFMNVENNYSLSEIDICMDIYNNLNEINLELCEQDIVACNKNSNNWMIVFIVNMSIGVLLIIL